MGNRVYKSSSVDETTTNRKYIVDISGKLPTILCEIDTSDSSLKKSYYYADAQILAQREHDSSDSSVYDEYFYVQDRLGSVRMVVAATIDQQTQQVDGVETVNSYTYSPFGNPYDGQAPAETVDSPWQFTGQYHDAEINQYYLRARQYDPTMMRFTARDAVRGRREYPLTLHKYLYCVNDPIDYIDPSGKSLEGSLHALAVGSQMHNLAISLGVAGVSSGQLNLLDAALIINKYTGPIMRQVYNSHRTFLLPDNNVPQIGRHTPGQSALNQLANELDGLSITAQDMVVLHEWAMEYNVLFQNHVFTSHWKMPHIHVGQRRPHIGVVLK